MAKLLPRQESGAEPTPKYASDAEIELAAQLRHQLEQRYLDSSAAPSSPQNRSGESH